MKVSIIMPVYNEERIVGESIRSAMAQDYPDKEIIVIDDASTDNTLQVCEKYPVEVFRNEKNKGLGGNLNECIKKAKGEYIIILCGDDVFCNDHVVSDMVKIFEADSRVGVIGRYYYQYMDGYPGAVMTIRSDILTSSCQPSGMGFRKKALIGGFTNRIFIEVPNMVKKVLSAGWGYQIIQYDTIAARLHPGVKGNAATAPSYYTNESPTLNWLDVMGEPHIYFLGFIQYKNRCPRMLLREIGISIRLKPIILIHPMFWACVLIALLVPGWILRPFSNFYRHRFTRFFVAQIERES